MAQSSFACEMPMLPRTFSVKKTSRETHDTFTLELAPEDGVEFAFSPGQFNMLYVFGVGEVPVSVSGDPAETGRLVHTVRAVGAVTKAMARLKKGDVLGVRGPFGTAWPVEESAGADVIIAAGGIGLAPLRPAVYRILAQRGKYRKVILLYGTRTPEDLLFRREMEKWRKRADMEVHVTVDRGTAGWTGNVGVVTRLVARAGFDPEKAVAMICGPEVMMRFTVSELERRPVAPDRVFVSMERNMKCGVGLCGHCQCGPYFICRSGPVFRYAEVADLILKREA